MRAYCVIELFVGLINWYGLKWSDDRDELNVFKSASFFQIYRTERSDVPAGPVTQLPIWCPPFIPRKPCLVYKFGYVVYTHSMFEHTCSLTWIHVLSYYTYCLWQYLFICPSSDGTYYGMVMSVRPILRPSLRPSDSPSAHFPHFSHTCFDILSWNFAHEFVLMYYRSSLSVVTLHQFLKELCLFVNLEYRQCAVFRTFLLHALTYRAEILHMTLFYCSTDQVRVSSISVNFCGASIAERHLGITFSVVRLSLTFDLHCENFVRHTFGLLITFLPSEVGLSYLACVFLMTTPFQWCHRFWARDLDRDLWPTLGKFCLSRFWFAYNFLVHLSRRLKCTIVIMLCQSSVRPSSLTFHIFNFSSETAEQNLRKLYRNQEYRS